PDRKAHDRLDAAPPARCALSRRNRQEGRSVWSRSHFLGYQPAGSNAQPRRVSRFEWVGICLFKVKHQVWRACWNELDARSAPLVDSAANKPVHALLPAARDGQISTADADQGIAARSFPRPATDDDFLSQRLDLAVTALFASQHPGGQDHALPDEGGDHGVCRLAVKLARRGELRQPSMVHGRYRSEER